MRSSRILVGPLAAALAVAAGCGDGRSSDPSGECVSSTEICNGVDDDCDGKVDEDLGTLSCGVGACATTVPACESGAARECRPGAPKAETCNGLDDDCDGVVDGGCECDPGTQRACYGGPAGSAGVGACRAGVQACDGGHWGPCSGEVLPADETCNGVDDDCDGQVDEGNPAGGGSCATGLPGACDAGVLQCTSHGMVCVQAVAPSPDLCNGVDDDCDPSTPDGSAEGWYGNACDGNDGDLCTDGTLACVGGAMACTDDGDTKVETCNGIDDDCDGQVDEGFALVSDPACPDATNLGSVKGDGGLDQLLASDWQERWYRVRIQDDPSTYSTGYLGARIQLTVPNGRYLYLDVYCASCGGRLVSSTYVPYWNGAGVAYVRRDEARGVDDSFDVLVRVREAYSWACGYWQLTVDGNATVASPTCD